MKTIVVYYSYSGNNETLANRVAAELRADTFALVEEKPRTQKTIFMDMLLGRRPRLKALPGNMEQYDFTLFMGPVWMFHIPSPLRSCFRALKGKIHDYAFASVNGGALGPNTKLGSELSHRLGKEPKFVLDLNVARLCEVKENPTTDDTGAYILATHPGDLEKLSGMVVKALTA